MKFPPHAPAASVAVVLLAAVGALGVHLAQRASPPAKAPVMAPRAEIRPEAHAPDPRPSAEPGLVAAPRVVVDTAPVGAIPPAPIAAVRVDMSLSVPRLNPNEISRFAAAAALYRKGASAGADPIAAEFTDPIARAALEWIALKSAPSPERLLAFEAAHRDWPAVDWLRQTREGQLFANHAAPSLVDSEFSREPPISAAGVLAAVRASLDAGRKPSAADAVRALWRERDLDGGTETAILREFGGMLTRADHKYRADRLLYAEKAAPALRAATLAGADEVALVNARLEAARGPLSPRAIAAVPASLQSDAGLIFARVQDARRANRTAEASAWLAMAPKDATALIDPDKWWAERRMVAREWLDRGAADQAYKLCSDAPTVSAPARVDAAFHAGWIALRFMNDAAKAARHFADARAAALTPLAIARASYWQGRAAEALNEGPEARAFYERAAAYPIAYYGQLAARRLGRDGESSPRAPDKIAVGDDRAEATRIVELYYDAGLEDFANALAFSAASVWTEEPQVAALGEVVSRRGSATANVVFGKIATERGFALDQTAFPTFGLPSFVPLPHSADIASVLAVARQESEFIWRASSGAGAKGLMQILPATAQMTARRAGVAFDFSRLVGDPAFNLQLGAAYLGQLTEDEGGSLEMTLAAYNAGAGRVAQWIAAYGDPRTGAVDPVDWVERIPFDETRDYVQRVSENLGVYRARLAEKPVLAAEARSTLVTP